MRPSSSARRYAEAAFQVAQEDGNVGEWVAELGAVSDRLTASSAVQQYFRQPTIGQDEKLQAIDMLFPEFRPHVLNLLRELASRQRFHLVPQVHAELARLERESRGVTDAFVTVARPVDESRRTAIAGEIGTVLGREIELHLSVDPALLGGIVIRIGDQLFDASVATRLQRLRQELAV